MGMRTENGDFVGDYRVVYIVDGKLHEDAYSYKNAALEAARSLTVPCAVYDVGYGRIYQRGMFQFADSK